MKEVLDLRINVYDTRLDEDRKNVLVKEYSKNYPSEKDLNTPKKIMEMMNKVFLANVQPEEHMWVIAMDIKCHPIGIFEVAKGVVNSCAASPREIFVRLCLCGAACFVLVHNHPSGDVTPSKEDKEFTERIVEAGKILNIECVDHIIIGDSYYSFSEKKEI